MKPWFPRLLLQPSAGLKIYPCWARRLATSPYITHFLSVLSQHHVGATGFSVIYHFYIPSPHLGYLTILVTMVTPVITMETTCDISNQEFYFALKV